jgi:hypothetical protein
MNTCIRALPLSLVLGCASTGAVVTQSAPAGPPTLRFEPARPPRFTPPVIEIADLEGWRQAEERLVMIDGQEVWALSRWTFLGETDPDTAQRIGAGHASAGVEATKSLLAKLGVQADQPKAPKLGATQLGERKIHWLWICDDACLASLHRDLGVEYDRDRARNAYVDQWQRESTKSADAAALAKLDKQFIDTDPSAWRGDGPWWANVGTSVVPYIDGEEVLIATATDDSKSSDLRRARSQELARANLARFFATRIHRQGPLTETEAEAVIRYSRVTMLDRRGTTSALAICDQECVKRSEAALAPNQGSDTSAARE